MATPPGPDEVSIGQHLLAGQGGEDRVGPGVVNREVGTDLGRCMLRLLVAEAPVQDHTGVRVANHKVNDLLSGSGAAGRCAAAALTFGRFRAASSSPM